MSHHKGLNLKEFKDVAKKNAKSIFYLLYECDLRSRLSNLLRCSLKILKVFTAIFWNEKKKKKFSSLENSQAAASGSLCKWTPFVITPNSVTSPSVLWKILRCSLCWLLAPVIDYTLLWESNSISNHSLFPSLCNDTALAVIVIFFNVFFFQVNYYDYRHC